MECIVQYLDDLEDIIYAFALKWERIRRVFHFMLFVAVSVSLQIFAVFLAHANPRVAVAVAALLMVGLLYRAVVTYRPDSTAPA